jgi:hypothetical protein
LIAFLFFGGRPRFGLAISVYYSLKPWTFARVFLSVFSSKYKHYSTFM